MRKTFTLTILFILLSSTFIFAQSKVKRYCEVLTDAKTAKPMEEKISIKIVLGKTDEFFSLKDSSILFEIKKVNDLSTSTDLLNFMTKHDWDLVTVINKTQINKSYYFIKEFNKSDFQ